MSARAKACRSPDPIFAVERVLRPVGRQGAGVIEVAGSDVTAAAPRDRAAMSFNSCGGRPGCEAEAPTYGSNSFACNRPGRRAGGSAGTSCAGGPMNADFFSHSAFVAMPSYARATS